MTEQPAAPAAVGTGSDGRAPDGRFGPNNGFGRGNASARRQRDLSAAIDYAVGPQDLIDVMAKLVELAKAGDAVAAKVVLDRTLGRSREAPTVIEMPLLGKLKTAKQIVDALVRIVRGAGAGELPLDVAERIGALVAKVGEAGCWRDVEARVAEIEKSSRGRGLR